MRFHGAADHPASWRGSVIIRPKGTSYIAYLMAIGLGLLIAPHQLLAATPQRSYQACVTDQSMLASARKAACNKVVEYGLGSSAEIAKAERVLGYLYLDEDDVKMALDYFTLSVALNERDAGARLGKAVAESQSGADQQALSDLSAAAALAPRESKVYYWRGRVLNDLEQHEAAIEALNEAIDRDPSYVLNFVERGNAYAGIGKFEQALVDYSSALNLDPRSAVALRDRAIANAYLGRARDALQDAGSAAKIEPGNVAGPTAYCWIHLLSGNLAAAEANCNVASQQDPDGLSVIEASSWVQLRLRNWRAAEEGFGRVLARARNSPTALFGCGLAQQGLGDATAASEDFRAARVLNGHVEALVARLRGR